SVKWRYPSGIPRDRGTVATVGTFDGVHLGHWRVLEEIRERAEASGRRSVLVTFDPHPLRVVRPDEAPPLLTTPLEKKEILAESGLDFAVFVRFTEALSRYEPRRFIEEILVGRIGVQELVIGYDHGFGRGRSGDVDTLRAVGDRLGFAVDVVGPVEADAEPISSTRIRTAVAEGRVAAAARGLGRPYSIRGVVVRGDGRGASIGFPTANLTGFGGDKLLPASGVYAVRVWMRGRGGMPGALHLGPRPTFPGATPTVEVHLLDADLDLYGERLRVDFIERIRGVRSFESVDGLVEQMGRDVGKAREILSPT
ncbi:MAG TPA: bifunctional riboflavin kinase/FAD synthetase, partial [Longimicrobiales bacterium]|nr:bifunctional riboflavin kinase/FAD synthetase [Longimicrobiales bacterium]